MEVPNNCIGTVRCDKKRKQPYAEIINLEHVHKYFHLYIYLEISKKKIILSNLIYIYSTINLLTLLEKKKKTQKQR